MSSDTDHPRQRTVAELLAEHGAAAGVTGRRRRRREVEAGEDTALEQTNGHANGASPPTSEWRAVAPPETDRRVRRDDLRSDDDPRGDNLRRDPLNDEPPPRAYAPEPELPRRGRADRRLESELPPAPALDSRPLDLSPPPVRERPTDQMPRIRDEPPSPPPPVDAGRTGPIEQRRVEPPPPPPTPPPAVHEPELEPWYEEDDEFDEDEFVARDYSADANAGAQHDEYTGDNYDDDNYEGDDYDDEEDDREAGPPTMIGAAPVGAEEWHEERTTRRLRHADAGGPPTQASAPVDFDDRPAGLGVDDDDDYDAEHTQAIAEQRPARSEQASSGQAWAMVIGQWIVGAIGGAALWVGFRFLWRSLPVVALAAAVLVTVGLVVVVRALLRNDDLRTTLFAVLVGLLLTVSPAILVLLGR